MSLKIELNHSAITELMMSDEVGSLIDQCGEDVANRAGNGYATRSYISIGRKHKGDNRRACNVYAETQKAKADNLKNNTLLKAVSK